MGCRGLCASREVVDHGRHRRPELQHEPGIQDVLARRAPVDEARRLAVVHGHLRRQVPHHRDHGVARLRRLGGDAGHVVQLGTGGRLNGLHATRGDHADRCLGMRQRGFDVQHPL